MKRLLTLTSILTIASFSFGAALNESDWTYDGSTFNESDASITINSPSWLTSNKVYSTDGTLSFTIEVPSACYDISTSTNTGLTVKLDNNEDYLYAYFATFANNTNRINVFAEINGDRIISEQIYNVTCSSSISYTYTIAPSEDNKYLLTITQDSTTLVNSTFEWVNIPESYENLNFSLSNNSPDSIKLTDFTYTPAVPEPATYAAIFGALALGFAAWRKRK